MKKVRYATGKLVNKYKLVLKDINDLNKKYEKVYAGLFNGFIKISSSLSRS